MVEEKWWSTSLAVTVDRKVKNTVSIARWFRSDTNVDWLEESRNSMSWRWLMRKKNKADRVNDAFRLACRRTCRKWEIRCNRHSQIAKKNRKRGKEKNNVTNKWNCDHYCAKGSGAVSRRNDRANRKVDASHCRVLKRSEKKRRVDNAIISDICR